MTTSKTTEIPTNKQLLEQYRDTGRWSDHLFSDEELKQIKIENKEVLDSMILPLAEGTL